MNITSLNGKTIILKMKRIDACRLLTACTAIAYSDGVDKQSREMWGRLHTMIREQIDRFDLTQTTN